MLYGTQNVITAGGKSKRFFEGWYYKVVSENQRHAVAIIPGIAMDENGKK